MELSLFDFDFTEANKDMFTSKKISEQFAVLQKLFKERKNSYCMNISDLPRDMIVYIDEFEKEGWIERHNGGAINIKDEYLIYHTPEEVIEEYRQVIDSVLARPSYSWYEDILPVVNFGPMPIRFKSDEERNLIYKLRKEVVKETTIKLGLKHFIEVPSSRGHKMNPFPSKWARKYVLPMIAELVIPITDYDEMENFFNAHVFFMGRRDWDRDGYRSDYKIPPYPEFKKLCPGSFDIACLCEAKDEKTVELVLDYSGSSYGYTEKVRDDLIYLYPQGWSMERYQSSLTNTDKELIKQDQERLKKLHSNNR